MNVEINLAGIRSAAERAELAVAIHAVDDVVVRAEQVTAAVRAELAR